MRLGGNFIGEGDKSILVNKSFKIRIYPNKQQADIINQTIGCSRFVYNCFLDLRSKEYAYYKQSSNFAKDCIDLTDIKNELLWLKEVDKFALQNSLRDLDKSYQLFFKSKFGFPKFKSKKHSKDSYRTTWMKNGTNKETGEIKGNIELFDTNIKLPKLKMVKCKHSFNFSNVSKINNCTISKSKSGKYFASVSCEVIIREKIKTGKEVGIDLGIKDLAILSNGVTIPNHKLLYKYADKLIKKQRNFAKMQNGSNNKEKQRIKIAKIYEKISNCKNDLMHKFTTQLVESQDFIVIENLNVKGMMKNRNLSKAVANVSFYEIRRQLTYKCNWYGKQLVIISRWFPSSKLCSNCGEKKDDLKLSDREYICEYCGIVVDRDYNASINILNEGKRLALV